MQTCEVTAGARVGTARAGSDWLPLGCLPGSRHSAMGWAQVTCVHGATAGAGCRTTC